MNRLLVAAAVSAALAAAQTPPATYPRAAGPVGPRAGIRSEWRVPTLFELNTFLGWKAGVPAEAFRGLTLAEAEVRIDKIAVAYVEGSDAQWVSPEIRKNLDFHLDAAEITAVKNRLRRFRLQMPVYRVSNLGPDDATRRKIFEFAKGLGVETLVANVPAASLDGVEKLADEFGINVALQNAGDLSKRSKRLGAVFSGAVRDVARAKDRIMVVPVKDAAASKDLLYELYRQDLKGAYFSLTTPRTIDETIALQHEVDNFEAAILPVLGDYMVRRSKTLAIRGPEELSAEVKAKIEAAVPHTPAVKPAKPRRLLVLDQRGGHAPVPHTNYALALMGKNTGAYEAVFSNDLDNLKYEKIRQFDAVMLNSSDSDITADPAVREGLARFVREGGGFGGIHAASWSVAFWPEFMEMTGASQGPHRVQQATLKIDDPESPIMKSFGGQSFTNTDEYYRMMDSGPQGTYYSREKVHVLMSVDLAKTPDFNAGRVPFQRQDNDYAVSWIKGYGKGRVFYTCLGHTADMFFDPKMHEFLLAAMQFLVGDLPADTAPSAELTKTELTK